MWSDELVTKYIFRDGSGVSKVCFRRLTNYSAVGEDISVPSDINGNGVEGFLEIFWAVHIVLVSGEQPISYVVYF